MIKNAKPWEQIQFAASADSAGQPPSMFRLKVPHGWIVVTGQGDKLGPTTYIPDGGHIWDPST